MNKQRFDWKYVLRRWGPILLTLMLLAGLYVYLRQSHMIEQIDFAHLRWEYLGLLVLVRLAVYGTLGLVLLVYTTQIGLRLDFTDWFGLSVAGALTNLLAPIAGGAVVRAAYLKLHYNLSVARYTSFVAVTALMNYVVAGVSGLTLLAILIPAGVITNPPIALLVMGALIAAPVILLAVPLERLPIPGKGRISRWIKAALAGWQEIRTKPLLLAELFALTMVLVALQGVSTYLGLTALGHPAPFLDTLFIGVAISAWRVTPTVGFGIQEVIGAAGAGLVGISPVEGFVSTLLNRFANWVVLFTSGPLYSYLLSRRLGQPLAQAAETVRDNGQRVSDQQGESV